MSKVNTLIDPEDHWSNEQFEEEVSASLISLYETKIINQKKIAPRQRLTEEALAGFRKFGVTIPGKDRLILDDGKFDTLYPLPTIASSSITISASNELNSINGYRHNFFTQRVEKMPLGFSRTGGGLLYRLVSTAAKNEGGLDGSVHYFSVDKMGNIHVADFFVGGRFMSEVDSQVMGQYKHIAFTTLNIEADKVNCWTIKAEESQAICTIGVCKEEVKSLLYARSLPITVTGRKRPILHLVASHKRRMKEGVEVDIESFLRGVKVVEMNGTKFTVKPPDILFKKN